MEKFEFIKKITEGSAYYLLKSYSLGELKEELTKEQIQECIDITLKGNHKTFLLDSCSKYLTESQRKQILESVWNNKESCSFLFIYNLTEEERKKTLKSIIKNKYCLHLLIEYGYYINEQEKNKVVKNILKNFVNGGCKLLDECLFKLTKPLQNLCIKDAIKNGYSYKLFDEHRLILTKEQTTEFIKDIIKKGLGYKLFIKYYDILNDKQKIQSFEDGIMNNKGYELISFSNNLNEEQRIIALTNAIKNVKGNKLSYSLFKHCYLKLNSNEIDMIFEKLIEEHRLHWLKEYLDDDKLTENQKMQIFKNTIKNNNHHHSLVFKFDKILTKEKIKNTMLYTTYSLLDYKIEKEKVKIFFKEECCYLLIIATSGKLYDLDKNVLKESFKNNMKDELGNDLISYDK